MGSLNPVLKVSSSVNLLVAKHDSDSALVSKVDEGLAVGSTSAFCHARLALVIVCWSSR